MHACLCDHLFAHVEEERTKQPTRTLAPSKPNVDFYFSKQRPKARQLGQPRRGLLGLEELGLKSMRQQLPTTQARLCLSLSCACVRSGCIHGYKYTYIIIHARTRTHMNISTYTLVEICINLRRKSACSSNHPIADDAQEHAIHTCIHVYVYLCIYLYSYICLY